MTIDETYIPIKVEFVDTIDKIIKNYDWYKQSD